MLHEHHRMKLILNDKEVEVIFPFGYLKFQKCGECERMLLSAFTEGQLCMDCEDKENEIK